MFMFPRVVRACVFRFPRVCVRTYVRMRTGKEARVQNSTIGTIGTIVVRTYIRTCTFRRLAHLPSTARITCTTGTIGTTRADSTTLAMVALGTFGTSVTPCIVGTLGVACQHGTAVTHTCAHVRTYVRAFLAARTIGTDGSEGREEEDAENARTFVRTYATRPVSTSVRMQRAPRPKQRSTCRSPPHGGQRVRTPAHGPMANGGYCGLQRKRRKLITIKHFKACKHNRALQAQSSTSRPLKTLKHNQAQRNAPSTSSTIKHFKAWRA